MHRTGRPNGLLALLAALMPAAALWSAPAAAPEKAVVPAPAPASAERLVEAVIIGRANAQRVVHAVLSAPVRPPRPGEGLTLSTRLDIDPGWHVNSSRPTLEFLIPTSIRFEGGDSGLFEMLDLAYPEGRLVALKFADEKLSVYEGETIIRATLRAPLQASAKPLDLRARLTYQACSDLACLPPETVEFAVAVQVAGDPVAALSLPSGPGDSGDGAGYLRSPEGGPAPAVRRSALSILGGEGGVAALRQERGLLVLLGVIFVAGLALNLTPCVYPMLPVTISFFVNQSGGGAGRRVGLPSVYVLGMALTYSILGLAAAMTGSLFGSTLQSPWVVGGLVALFVVMALSMFGLFEIRLPGFLMRLSGGRRGILGALLMGLTVGIVAAPCIGPFVVPLLVFVGVSGSPLLGFWLFFVLALGLGLPSLVLGIFSGMLGSLPRSGVWLIYAKKVMGVALIAVAIYFLQPFLSDRQVGWLALGFAVAAAAYLGLLERTRLQAPWFTLLKLGIGAAVLGLGVWVAMPLVSAREAADWRPYSEAALREAAAQGKPVVIDFFAEWCFPCKEIERFTFSDPRVIEALEQFTLLKADLTSFESEPERVLRDRYEVIGVPTIVLIDAGGVEHRDLRLHGFESPDAFLLRLGRVAD